MNDQKRCAIIASKQDMIQVFEYMSCFLLHNAREYCINGRYKPDIRKEMFVKEHQEELSVVKDICQKIDDKNRHNNLLSLIDKSLYHSQIYA